MRIDRHIPLLRELRQSAHMVEVSVSQHNAFWGLTKRLRRGLLDAPSPAANARIHQYPRTIFFPEKVDIRHHDGQVPHAVGDLIQSSTPEPVRINHRTSSYSVDRTMITLLRFRVYRL